MFFGWKFDFRKFWIAIWKILVFLNSKYKFRKKIYGKVSIPGTFSSWKNFLLTGIDVPLPWLALLTSTDLFKYYYIKLNMKHLVLETYPLKERPTRYKQSFIKTPAKVKNKNTINPTHNWHGRLEWMRKVFSLLSFVQSYADFI